MAIFKCKMCGGTLEVGQGESVGVCEYCGTRQTLPKLDDERKTNLYDRANHFRRNNDYDKAMGIYEQILSEDNTDAEAYWSLVLCKYGIEYVEDPATHKRVPTVNRAQYTSVFADEDYKAAIQHADAYQKDIYEAEAKAIDEIQKGILEISQKEEPFDVFICYKETGADGRRTPDSVLATELYHELTREGFKVFFSRITLEDKLGTAYEPYIFAALNSAKVMVVLGTKAEHFNAVWVKNEWSRYLALIKTGARKNLIPAYKDMDPYDLPEEFSHLQAQDMSKLGFMSDLVRGINKILSSEKEKNTVKETVVNGNASVAPLLKRAFMFLEDGEWSSADEYCEKVLDLDPENAEAYLGKLMVELNVQTQEQLKHLKRDFSNNKLYSKVMRYANDSLKERMEEYIKTINDRRLEVSYVQAVKLFKEIKTQEEAENVESLFMAIIDYKDSKELLQKCEEIRIAKEIESTLKKYAERLERALTQEEITNQLELMSEDDTIPEIRSFIEEHKNEYEIRVETANSLYATYVELKEKIKLFEEQTQSLIIEIRTLKDKYLDISTKISVYDRLLKSKKKFTESIRAQSACCEKKEQEVNKVKQEITQLGVFSIKQKREKNAQLSFLLDSLTQAKEELRKLETEINDVNEKLAKIETKEVLSQEITNIQREIDEKNKLLKKEEQRLEEEHLYEELSKVTIKLELPKYKTILLNSEDETVRNTICSVWNFCPELAKESEKNSKIYAKAKEYLKGSEKSDYLLAMDQLQRISGWQDSDELIAFCKVKVYEIEAQEQAAE